MVNSLQSFITNCVITDEDRLGIIELETKHRELRKQAEAYCPVNIGQQIKAWEAQIKNSPDRTEELKGRIATYPSEALELYRFKKAACELFMKEHLKPFNEYLKEKIKTELIKILNAEEANYSERSQYYRITFQDPVIESLRAGIEWLDAISGNLSTKIFNENPNFFGAI